MKTSSALLIILHFFFQFNLSHAEEKIISLEKDKNIILNGNFIQGGLVYGKSIPKTSIKFMKRFIFQDSDNKFVFGMGRDYPETAVLEIKYNNDIRKINIKIKKQVYKIQKIKGLPKKMVTPPESVYKRIIRENKEIAKVRALNSKINYIFQDFIWPVQGIITGVFGSQRILNGKPRRPHYGIDIAASKGTNILAPTDSIVRMAEDNLYFTGGTIMLDHGHGVTSVYSHLSKLLVQKNQKIKKGHVIGHVGSTGRSTGPHLDWRINWFDQRLDPSLFIKQVKQ
tara:strand:+ start:871 stop:1719 length:849 start_codon:yes stop_codon:yes gene_type:complete